MKSRFGLLDGRISTKLRRIEEGLKGMVSSLSNRLSFLEEGIKGVRTFDKVGTVQKVTGLLIEFEGPEASVGQVCTIISDRNGEMIDAQVLIRQNVVLLMALIVCISFTQDVR